MIVSVQKEAGVHGTLAPTGDWTYGAAILTFVFPMLLFIGVAGALYVLYTKPHLVPGHRYNMQLRAATATAAPESAAPARPAVDTDTITGLEPPENEG
jgi:hypothetical protein